MRTDIAGEIKQRIGAKEFFRHYGFVPNRANVICCPFHREKTPSFHIYDGERGWHCFGCGEGGDIISFEMKYFGLGFQAALEKINDDFGLMLPIGREMTLRERHRLKTEEEKRKRAREKDRAEFELIERNYNAALDRFVERDKALMAAGKESREYYRELARWEISDRELAKAELELYNYDHRRKNHCNI